MFHSSSQHPFDIMFVILCVIAGATSHTISNTSKASPTQMPPRFRTSVIDFILDTSLVELIQSSNSIHETAHTHIKHTPVTKIQTASNNICLLLSAILSNNQLRFCQRHQDLLETILPQVIYLTKQECARITSDLRWNCTSIEAFLDRSNSISFTKEGALVRSLLSASMMHLTIKVCEEHSHRFCRCPSKSNDIASNEITTANESGPNRLPTNNLLLTEFDMRTLDDGSPLRLSKSLTRHQGCFATVAFAEAFTRVFLDSDDTKSLTKSQKILNEGHSKIDRKSFGDKRIIESDYRDLSFIKWTKSAINLHNSNVGRQLVRKATRRQCRCHGLSGMCQFQTCWDQLSNLQTISLELRKIYLFRSKQIGVENSGSYHKPDLYLVKLAPQVSSIPLSRNSSSNNMRLTNQEHLISDTEQISPNELIYYHESPDFCEEQETIKHYGIRGRSCTVSTATMAGLNNKTKGGSYFIGAATVNSRERDINHLGSFNSCEQLCCHRGYYSELVLEMVTCNCRFKFCCKVDCELCLRQLVQYYCL